MSSYVTNLLAAVDNSQRRCVEGITGISSPASQRRAGGWSATKSGIDNGGVPAGYRAAPVSLARSWSMQADAVILARRGLTPVQIAVTLRVSERQVWKYLA